jgi:hypothetical protein
MAARVVSIDLRFRDSNHSRLAYHSFANLINVVHAELQLLARMCDDDAALEPAIHLCEAATWAYRDEAAAQEHALALASFADRIRDGLSHAQPSPQYARDAEEARALVAEVLAEANLHTQESLARHGISRESARYDGESVEALVMAGTSEVSAAADCIRVAAGEPISAPCGLLKAVGRLAGGLCPVSAQVSVSISGESPGRCLVRIHTDPLDFDPTPHTPPSHVDYSDPESAATAGIAEVYYIASPGGRVSVDAAGNPFVKVAFGR